MLHDFLTSSPRGFGAPLAILTTILGLALAGHAQIDERGALPDQFAQGVMSEKPMLFAELGWRGQIALDAWMPVRLSIQAGLEAFQGAVIIEYPQDPTQTTAITIPVAATPGRISQTQAVICLPPGCDRIQFRLVNSSGRTVHQFAARHYPGAGDIQLPFSADTSAAVIAVGRTGGPASTVSHLHQAVRRRERGAAGNVNLVRPAELPMAWTGYDNLLLLAADADAAAEADPRALAGIRDWVSAGGHLVIFVHRPGDQWRRWLPASPLGWPITIDETSEVPLPGDLGHAVRTAGPYSRDALPSWSSAEAAGPQGYLPPSAYGPPRPPPVTDIPRRRPEPIQRPDQAAQEQEEDASEGGVTPGGDVVRPVQSIVGRQVRLTPIGEALGWRVRWLAGAPARDETTVVIPDFGSRAGAAGLLAEGPFGYGRITIIGIDPRQVAPAAPDRGAHAAWTDAFPNYATLVEARQTALAQSYSWGYSGRTPDRAARGSMLDDIAWQITEDPPTLWFLILTMLVLALLVGPVDAWALGRLRLRHRSWLTALCWITLASLAAFAMPHLVRASGTKAARVCVLDVFMPPEVPGPTPVALPPLAWQTSITGIFADGTQTLRLAPDPPAPGWWRGVSALDFGQFQSTLTSITPMLQRLPDLGSVSGDTDPWGGLSPLASSGHAGNLPQPTSLRTWTFRAFEDIARVQPTVSAAARLESDGRVGIEIRGLGPESRIVHASARTSGRWHELRLSPAGAGSAGGRITFAGRLAGAGSRTPPPQWTPWTAQPSPHHWVLDAESRVPRTPSLGFVLSHPQRRTPVIEALSSGEDWIAVHLLIENAPPDIQVHIGGDVAIAPARTMIARILLPHPGSAGPADSEHKEAWR